MAFREIDQTLIDECVKSVVDFDRVNELINDGADINAFDEEFEDSLYEAILDCYVEIKEGGVDLTNLYKLSEIFLEKGLILNHKPEDNDYYIPSNLRFLPPEKIGVDIFKMILEKGTSSFEDIEHMISDYILDLHLCLCYLFEDFNYSDEDSENYFLELIYWACAYQVKYFPEKCSEDLLDFNWFKRERNMIEMVKENRSTAVFVEDLETHERIEIGGWSLKY